MNDHTGDGDDRLQRAIEAQEALRGVVPDDIVDAAIASIRQRLHASRADDQRRRQVTVLFADVSGFTSMSSKLDPELVAGAMNDIWTRLDTVISEHGGRIDKHIGDAVMAVWGATSTEENDPERAVRAALAMQDELSRRGVGTGLAMRIGINTGPVHLGAVGAGTEFTAMGDAVNVASRVEGLAPLGGVLVTHDTYRHIRGVFDVEPLDPVVVKGKSEPLLIYVVHRAKARAFHMATRGIEGVETRMIGRSREIAVLQAEFETVWKEAITRRVTIIGDAGVGKSRLLYEFENWIELHPASAYFFKGRALATRQSVPLGLARDLLAHRFGISDSDGTSSVTAKLHAGFASLLSDDEADLVGHWVGFDLRSSPAVQRLLGSGQLAATARAHLIHAIETLAADGPVVMFFEDLHWADDETLELIDQMVAHSTTVSILVVAVGRPTVLDRAAAGLLDRSSVALRLSQLDDEATRMLVAEVLQKCAAIPDSVVDLIVERADGNAYYVEELVKMLIDDGVIESGESWEPWHVRADRLEPDRVPATLTGVLQARLDGLAPAERGALQRSSVVGRVFWDDTVALLGNEELATTAASLDSARRRELVLRRARSAFDETVEYSFKHALLREVTYETVLLRDRQRLHGLVALWIDDHAGERAGEFAGLIAMHHRLAGDLQSAAELMERAGVVALESGNAAAARRSLDEAFDLWTATGRAPTLDAQTAMAEACLRLGDIEGADRFGQDALRIAASPAERLYSLYIGSWIASEQGDRARESALLEEAMPEAERQGGLLLAKVLCGRSVFELEMSDFDAAREDAVRAQELAAELGQPAITRQVLSLLGSLAIQAGDLAEALRLGAESVTVVVDAGDLEGEAIVRGNVGVVRHLIGDADGERVDYEAALVEYEQARKLCLRLGRRMQAASLAANMGQVHVRLGDDSTARGLIHEGITVVRQAGGVSSLLFSVLAEADRRLVLGETSSALKLIGMVQNHPAVRHDDKTEIGRILGRSGLPTSVIEQGLARGAPMDFDDVVEQVVQRLEAMNDD